jgi:hypothetical protein
MHGREVENAYSDGPSSDPSLTNSRTSSKSNSPAPAARHITTPIPDRNPSSVDSHIQTTESIVPLKLSARRVSSKARAENNTDTEEQLKEASGDQRQRGSQKGKQSKGKKGRETKEEIGQESLALMSSAKSPIL